MVREQDKNSALFILCKDTCTAESLCLVAMSVGYQIVLSVLYSAIYNSSRDVRDSSCCCCCCCLMQHLALTCFVRCVAWAQKSLSCNDRQHPILPLILISSWIPSHQRCRSLQLHRHRHRLRNIAFESINHFHVCF